MQKSKGVNENTGSGFWAGLLGGGALAHYIYSVPAVGSAIAGASSAAMTETMVGSIIGATLGVLAVYIYNKIKHVDEKPINEYGDDDFEKLSRETEHNINPYKNQDDVFVTNYKQIDDQTILVKTSDNNVEEFYYVTDETEGTSEMDSTTYITFRNGNDSRELIAKTNYNPNGISFDSLDFIKVKNI